MIFSPELARKVLAGEKTVTRRRTWHRYQAGHAYAVQPGRGKRHLGHIRVWGKRIERLGEITSPEAWREGFACVADFQGYWRLLHGAWDPDQEVAVLDFDLAPRCPDCQVPDG